MEVFVFAPPVNFKVTVQGENIGCFKFICQTNQAGVGEVDLAVAIFSEDLLYAGGFA